MSTSDSLFQRQQLQLGARACLAPAVAVFIFAFVMGALAHQHGWQPSYLMLFCLGIVGASIQAVSLQLWGTSHDMVPILIACFAVHLRYILICASIAPLLSRLSFREKLLAVHFTTDSNWVMTIARQRSGNVTSAAFLFGGGVLVVSCLTVGNLVGFWAAGLVSNVRTLGFDFAIPGVFLCLLVVLWKSSEADSLPWISAALVALVVKYFVAGSWYIVIGALAGAAIAGIHKSFLSQGEPRDA